VVTIEGSADAYDPVQVPYVIVEFAMNTQSLRFRTDGVDPTSAVGLFKQFNQSEVMATQRYNKLKLIRAGASDSNIIVMPMTI